MQKLHVIITQLVKRIRKEKSISQEELASLAGVDRTYVSSIERGTKNITVKSLSKILDGLQLDTKDFAVELIIQSREKPPENKRDS